MKPDPFHALDLVERSRVLSSRLPGTWDRRAREFAKAAVNYRGFRRAFVRGFLFSHLSRGCPLIVAPFGNVQLLVDSSDDEIGRVVFMTGGYERIYMECALQYLQEQGCVTAGTTFVDIGANIGTSTVDALVHFGFHQSASFEPSTHNYALLTHNIRINGLEDRAVVMNLALSDYCGTGSLELSENPGDHRVVRASEHPECAVPAGFEPTNCRTFDSLVADGLINLDVLGLVWLDTQGHELYVLRGATTVIEKGVPIVIEYWPPEMTANGSLQSLEELVADCYEVAVDLRLLARGLATEAVSTTNDFGPLRARYARSHTDLLLLQSPRSN